MMVKRLKVTIATVLPQTKGTTAATPTPCKPACQPLHGCACPHSQGTLSEVCAAIDAHPAFTHTLDRSKAPSACNRTRWENGVGTLSIVPAPDHENLPAHLAANRGLPDPTHLTHGGQAAHDLRPHKQTGTVKHGGVLCGCPSTPSPSPKLT